MAARARILLHLNRDRRLVEGVRREGAISGTSTKSAPDAAGALGGRDKGIRNDHRSASASAELSDPTHPPDDRLGPYPAGRSRSDLATRRGCPTSMILVARRRFKSGARYARCRTLVIPVEIDLAA